MTVPQLLAAASGSFSAGMERCYYCGAACDATYLTAQWVKGSFTGIDGVACPGSLSVCVGCTLCMTDQADITLVDGEQRQSQKMRSYSWLLTPRQTQGATKSHLADLRRFCLEGLSAHEPWAIVLSDSGQKHLLYRGVVNQPGAAWYAVTLEGERVDYAPHDLADRLNFCGQLVAATGKPALAEPITMRFATAVMERYADGFALLSRWADVQYQPLSRLAAWLSPNKEICDREYPATAIPDHGGVSPQTGEYLRSNAKTGGRPQRKTGTQGECGSLFDNPGSPVQ